VSSDWRSPNAAPVADEGRLLLHRATSALYPPGSTWKLATTAAALRRGLV
jgi:cell division protein FtsI/penicillin-binding protein 2